MAGVCTIPPGVPFVDALAQGILDRVGGAPLDLAAVTVLLPNRRACRALREAFLRLSDGAPRLLPRMSPLGDIDSDELGLAVEEIPGLAGALDLPPAISGLRRQLLLSRLVMKLPKGAAGVAQAARLAAELGRLLDQVHTERLDFARLQSLVPEDYATHWQVTLKFLTILTEAWPAILTAEGVLDAADRRNRVLAAQTEAWRAKPPADPVFAAGTTGSIPAVADLLAAIAAMPSGMVVLPGLDQQVDAASWDGLDEAHPQFGLKSLLDRLGLDRADVQPWSGGWDGTPPARARLIAEALRPAATTDGWRALRPPAEPGPLFAASGLDARGLDGLARLDCPGPQEEAGAIALMMRAALETPGRTAALVTPDRALARRVAAALKRWDLAVDDAGGRPLAETAVGTYLRLIADLGFQRAAPVPLLALLKHPLSAGGQDPARFRMLARDLERAVLRGPRPESGFGGLLTALRAAEDARFDRAERPSPGPSPGPSTRRPDGSPDGRTRLMRWLEGVAAIAEPFMAAMAGPPLPLKEWLHLHGEFAEALATTPHEQGWQRLWRHDDGEAAAHFLNELTQAATDFPAVPAADYPALIEALMAGRVVRPRYGRHPRLAILGLLEARLQHFDETILGGLNEGSWPPDAAADPWLSRPMRKAFGLAAPERMIGQAAHDFAQLACAPDVVLTRAARVEGTPTVPSRWLLRLDTVLEAAGLGGKLSQAWHWRHWATALDRPDAVRPTAPPEPRPPVAARPRRLSVTEIETWMRDPYAIYARHVLRLSRLDPIGADPGAAERGQFIHAALDAFLRDHGGDLPPEPLAVLLQLGRAAFGEGLARPEVWAFWWPRFERVAGWFVETEAERRRTIRPLATEIRGTLRLDGPAGPFLLTAKADRIDRLPDGTLAIIDYKTGSPPRDHEIALGFAPQLPLEAAIATAGGFTGIAGAAVAELAFWKLSGGEPPGAVLTVKGDAADLAAAARAGLEALVRAFDHPDTPYPSQPRPEQAPRYTDYAHLARLQEWSAGGGEVLE